MRRFCLVLVFAACSHAAPATSPAVTPAAPPAEPLASSTASTSADAAFAPQLFTVEQLRDGNPRGRVIELRIEADGKPTTILRMEFVDVDATRATIHSTIREEDGTVVSDETGAATWDELHTHGQYPATATTIDDNVTVTVPAGTFTTRLYTTTSDGMTRKFWFATDMPGPPVQMTTEQGGKVVMHGQMVRAR